MEKLQKGVLAVSALPVLSKRRVSNKSSPPSHIPNSLNQGNQCSAATRPLTGTLRAPRRLEADDSEVKTLHSLGVAFALPVALQARPPERSRASSSLYVGHRWPEPHALLQNHQSGQLGLPSPGVPLAELHHQCVTRRPPPALALVACVHVGQPSVVSLTAKSAAG